MKRNKQFRAVDFFSGAGGLTYGLRVAGIDVLAGIDNDESCKMTYEVNNSGSKYLCKDISKYNPAELAKEIGVLRNDDNLIFAGCAPCQYWSIINTTRERSRKGKDLILDFQRFIDYFLPGYIIVENVPGVSSQLDSPMGRFIWELESLGYHVAHEVTDMSAYGIPQSRRRFTLLASRLTEMTLPKKRQTKKSVRDSIGVHNGFMKIGAGTKDRSPFLHTVSGLSEKNIKRLKLTPRDGGNRTKWQAIEDLGLDCYRNKGNIFHDTYGRMWWDKPAPTITTKFFSISNGRFAHPEENRAISLREGATLQTFPKKYKFHGSSIQSIAKMIGNAVPPRFATILGRHILKTAASHGGQHG